MPFREAKFLASAVNQEDYPNHGRAEVALAGRSNVGKSSLINALTAVHGLAHVSKRPGRTQTINFFSLNECLCLVDLPGYGFAKVPERVKRAWGPMIETYLQNREQLRAVCLLLDARHGPTGDDRMLRRFLAVSGRPVKLLATKWDKLKKNERSRRLHEISQAFGSEAVLPVSSENGEGMRELMSYLVSMATR